MKRIILIMATAMLAISASAQQTTNKTLYIVDGKVVSEEQFKGIKNEDVDDMSVFEGIESAIVITTKKPQKPGVVVIRGKKDSDADALKLNVTGVSQAKMDDVIILDSDTDVSTQKDPLMLLTDGEKTMKIESVSALNIKPEDILHITMIHSQSLDSKATEQFKKYGDVTNGVTLIQVKDLKKYKK